MKIYHARSVSVGVFLLLGLVLTGFTVASNLQNTMDDITDAPVDLAIQYVETHDVSLLAPDAVLVIVGRDEPLVGSDAISAFTGRLYASRGVTLGVDTSVTEVFQLAENLIWVEYNYHGTVFFGDVYPLDTMLDYSRIDVSMVSIFEIEDGLITREFLLEASTPMPVTLNDADDA